jgi:ribosomal protein L7/L12
MGPISDKVGLIRCIRTYDRRRLGLKEAKDIADSLADAGRVVLEVEPKIKPTFRVELRKFGLGC